MNATEAGKLVDETVEEIALVLAGIFALHGVANEVVWQAMKHIDMAHEAALAKLEGLEPRGGASTKPRPASLAHPAVEALISKLRTRRLSREDGA